MLPTKSKARPSKAVHVQRQAGGGDEPMDDLLGIVLPSSSTSRGNVSDNRMSIDSDGEEDEEDEDEEDGEASVSENSDAPVPAAFTAELGTKKRRALGAMMPAVFFKKAQADLKLMEREKKEGLASGSDHGSGDEVDDSSSGDGRHKGRAKTWRDPKRLKKRVDLRGDAFTDESGDDSVEELGPNSDAEGDAVSSWLQSFQPRRQGPGDEDIVDQFLKQARQKTRRAPKDPSKRRQGPSKGKQTSKGADSSKGASTSTRLLASTSKHQLLKAPTVSLDTGEALFDYTSLRTTTRASEALPIERHHPPATRALGHIDALPVAPSIGAHNAQLWSTFGKFSHDFDITPLPSGLQLPSNSFLRESHLISDLSVPTRPSPCISFGIPLLPDSPPPEIQALLPTLCDSIFDATTDELDGSASLSTATHKALRFLGKYSTSFADSHGDGGVVGIFASSISSHLDRLETRLMAFEDPDPSPSSIFKSRQLDFSWILVDLATRIAHLGSLHRERFLRLTMSLVVRLLAYNPSRTMKSLKNFTGDILPADLTAHDVSVQGWVGLVNLAISPVAVADIFDQESFWKLVISQVENSAHTLDLVRKGETVCYTAMMLCAISQFSSFGVCLSSPRLDSHWPAILRALDAIDPSALGKTDNSQSSTMLARRDRYIWILFARCLVLSTRWNWGIDLRGELIPRLFDIVNTRRLADLTIESQGDFPHFLQKPYDPLRLELDPQVDTAFMIFLKLVYKAASSLSSQISAPEKRRQLTRLFLRLSPMSLGPWSRSSSEITRSPSILVNHYALFTTFAVLSPPSAQQRLDQARRLLAFGDVDEHARRTCIRAILYFAFNLQQLRLPLLPVTEWFSDIVGRLRTEYLEIENKNLKDRQTTRANLERKGEMTPLWQRAILLTMVLRSIQLVMRFTHAPEGGFPYPELSLLHPGE